MQENYLYKLEQELKLRNYSIRTIKAYEICISYFLKKINKKIDQIIEKDIINFLLFLQDNKKAPKTINLYKQAIKFFFREIVKSDIKLDIHFSKEAKKLPVVLNKSEILKLLETITNIKHKMLISLSY
jgi:site-specific recombinase XerD